MPPQKRIEDLKNQIRKVEAQNQKLKAEIESTEESTIKHTKDIAEMKKKSVQANSDKIELLRDLATYESNFGDVSGLKTRLSSILYNVQKTRHKI